jgi:hypothetical protein
MGLHAECVTQYLARVALGSTPHPKSPISRQFSYPNTNTSLANPTPHTNDFARPRLLDLISLRRNLLRIEFLERRGRWGDGLRLCVGVEPGVLSPPGRSLSMSLSEVVPRASASRWFFCPPTRIQEESRSKSR